MDGVSRLREEAEGAVSRGDRHMGWTPFKLRIIVPRKHVLVLIFLMASSCVLVLQIINKSSLFIVDKDDLECSTLPSESVSQAQSVAHDPGRGLIEAIQRARRVASGSVSASLQFLSPEDLNIWNERHPCQSREPDGLLASYNDREDGAENLPLNPLWDQVFEEYSNLHRQCMRKLGDVGDDFLQKNTSSGCKFLVADVANKTEFGDKILVLASSLLYAILTQRVILVPGSTLVPSYMCEPFVGSSWLLDAIRVPLRPTSFRHLWNLDGEIFIGAGRRRRFCSDGLQPPYAVGMVTNHWQPHQRFYCSHEQAVFSQANFVYLSGFGYTIPKLFATPVFRPVLEALFPDRIVLSRLLRSAFLPGNRIWKQVKGLENGYLRPAHRLVGIEMGYNRRGMPVYKSMNKILAKRITDCLIRNDILPDIINSWEADATPRPEPTPIFRVLTSSLYSGLKDHLSRIYERNPTSTGEAVGVVQVSQNGNEQFSLDADVEAFKEALLLSFSDHLLVTPKSALGSVAQAYGALIPWFIEVRVDGWLSKYGTCERGKTIEACNHFAEKKYWCPSDSTVDGKIISDVVPYIDNCLTIDHDDGLQLITSSRS